MKKIIFKGSGVALVTPMKEDFGVDYKTLDKLIEFHLKNKTDAIIICGTTGESATLSDLEREKIIAFTIKKVNKKIPVIVGTGSNNTLHTLELSLKAEELCADGLLIVTPYYNKTSQKGLIKHYTYIADRIRTPIILYNVPSRTGINIMPDTYKIISEHSNIVAVKEANGDISQLAKTVSLCGKNLNFYSGNDEQILPFLALGGIGIISVFANIFPKQCHDIVNLFFECEHSKSLKLFLSSLELMENLFCDVNPIPVKASMSSIGMPCGNCRLPLTDINKKSLEKIKTNIKNYQKINLQ
ncbi:MAG: 4-hydroxy-tetrahydrodipicolinate synthase [Oscillospiraceae bacterium]|jgi:4-hydroxy-tetrahydrodipicolinate synthase|nr:4-hydroxy-tetrahydrodipicolinate synthase [Oscillospiraceae bacterium]